MFERTKRFLSDTWRLAKATYGEQLSLTSTRGWDRIGSSGVGLTEDQTLTIAANYACRRNIAYDTAKIPFKMLEYGVNAAGLETRTKIDGDSIAYIFNTQFNPNMTAFVGRSLMKDWQVGIGNAYAEIVRDETDMARELYPIHPSRVTPRRFLGTDRFEFVVRLNSGKTITLPEDRMLHLIGYSADGRFGIPMVQMMMNTLGLTSALELFLKKFYENSARPGAVITSVNTLGPDTRKELYKEFNAEYGGADNAGKTLVLDLGLDVKWFESNFKAMEMTDLKQMQKNDIAMLYRMPMIKLQDAQRAQGWSTLEQLESSYVGDTLLPWLVSDEQEIHRQLMKPFGIFEGYADSIAAHFETKGLLRGDITTRAAFCESMENGGAMSPNERREIEDMNPLDEPMANETFIQSAFIPLKMAGQAVTAQVEAAKNPPTSPQTASALENMRLKAALQIAESALATVQTDEDREAALLAIQDTVTVSEKQIKSFANASRIRLNGVH